MTTTVGARIQIEETPSVVRPLDRGLVAIMLIAGVAVHAWAISHTILTSRDSLGFARYAVNLGSPPKVQDRQGTAIDVIRKEFDNTMAYTGCNRIEEITPDILFGYYGRNTAAQFAR